MSFLDKVKETAQSVAAETKKGAAKAQEKIEHTQTRRKADDLAKQLGYLIAGERTGGPAAGTEADRLVEEITALEAQLQAEAPTEGEEPKPEGEEPKPEGEGSAG